VKTQFEAIGTGWWSYSQEHANLCKPENPPGFALLVPQTFVGRRPSLQTAFQRVNEQGCMFLDLINSVNSLN